MRRSVRTEAGCSCTSQKLVLKPLCEKEKEDVLCGHAEIAGGACKNLIRAICVGYITSSQEVRMRGSRSSLSISGSGGAALNECLHLSTLRIGNRSQDRNFGPHHNTKTPCIWITN